MRKSKMKYFDQRGVAIVLEVVIVAAVLAVVGFGIYVNAHAKKPTASVSGITPTPSHSATPTPSSTPTPVAAANEFDVAQLGFKMALPGGLDGLTYTVDTTAPAKAPGGSTYTVSIARFTTQYLQQAGCSTSAGPIGIGSISRYPFDPRQVQTADLGTIKQVGNFYLEENGAESACGNNATVNTDQTNMMQLLSQAFNTAAPL